MKLINDTDKEEGSTFVACAAAVVEVSERYSNNSLDTEYLINTIKDEETNFLAEVEKSEPVFKRYKHKFPLLGQRKSAIKKGLPKAPNAVLHLLTAELSTGVLMGIQDNSCVHGSIVFRKAQDGEEFEGMRSLVKCNLDEPVLVDDQGIIASLFQGPDKRTMLSPSTDKLLLLAFSFGELADKRAENALSFMGNLIVPKEDVEIQIATLTIA